MRVPNTLWRLDLLYFPGGSQRREIVDISRVLPIVVLFLPPLFLNRLPQLTMLLVIGLPNGYLQLPQPHFNMVEQLQGICTAICFAHGLM